MKTSHSLGTVLITGATSGIGFELAKLFAKDNYDLVLVARDKEKLIHVSKQLQTFNELFIKVIVKDLSSPRSPEEIHDELKKDGIDIDVLINNAGFATHGVFSEIPATDDLNQIQVNVTSLTHLTKLFLPHMLERKAGKVLNIASTAAFFPGPYMAVYYASKAFVLSFSEALAEEVQGTGVSVTTLCPGPTRTNFSKHHDIDKTLLFRASPTMSAEQVAQIGYDGLMKGKRVVIAGKRNLIQAIGSKFIGRKLAARIAKRVNK